MALDLSALEEKIDTRQEDSGKPLMLLLTDIEQDPNQPRTEFTQEAMDEMKASIKERGVKQPVSVRPHPIKKGKWILNFGARRYRASIAAGLVSIPAFVDETSNDFDQVIENEQRENLKPMELALFIKRKLDEGFKKSEIARLLSKPAATITEHLALIAAPVCITDVYRQGKCTSPKTLYELRSLYEKFPEAIEAWCLTSQEITRKSVANLAEQLKANNNTVQRKISDEVDVNNKESNASEPMTELNENNSLLDSGFEKAKKESLSQDTLLGSTTVEAEENSSYINNPCLLVECKGRLATLLLNRRPSALGLVYIRYEDNNQEAEVDANGCQLKLLKEAND